MSAQIIIPVVPVIRTCGRPVTLPMWFWIALWGCTAAIAVVVMVWMVLGFSAWWQGWRR